MQCGCGSEWWVEERLMQPAAALSQDPRLMTLAKQSRYRLRCAECGAVAGEIQNPEQAAETPRKGSKRHG